MISRRLHSDNRQKGFTIVEFMVATMVFSVVLLATTAAILHISRIYQRSLHQSNTQAAARYLVDTVAQAVQFSSSDVIQGSPIGATMHYCIGNKQILYVPGRQISSNAGSDTTKTFHGVIARPNNNCLPTDIQTTNISNDVSKELLGNRMRLSKFTINANSDGLYTISARVVYGDDDLLCSPTVANSCVRNAPTMSAYNLRTRTDLQCKPAVGSEYCAVSELTTTVQRRL